MSHSDSESGKVLPNEAVLYAYILFQMTSPYNAFIYVRLEPYEPYLFPELPEESALPS